MASVRFLVVTGAVLIAALLWLTMQRPRSHPPAPPLPVFREIGTFSVTNQAAEPFGQANLRGRPWAVNLIFTRCPGPCLQLSRTMARIQEGLGQDSHVGLLSVTSDPEFDRPSVLREYARKVGAQTNRWQFVTGTKEEIRRLAVREFLMVLLDKPENERVSEEDLFLHSTLIAVIDAQGRLRGTVEGLTPGAAEQALGMLRQLEIEAKATNGEGGLR